jgi:hypothetical protein
LKEGHFGEEIAIPFLRECENERGNRAANVGSAPELYEGGGACVDERYILDKKAHRNSNPSNDIQRCSRRTTHTTQGRIPDLRET